MAQENAVAETDTCSDDGKEVSTVDGRLAKLEKALTESMKRAEDEAKRAAGLDKKVGELLGEKKTLQESTYSKDKLLEIREAELKEKQGEWENKTASERLEIQKLRIEVDRRDVVSKIDGFPAYFVPWVPGGSRDEIEANAREFMKHWVKDRNIAVNAKIVTGRPQSASGKQVTAMTVEDFNSMNPRQQQDWAKRAQKEDPEGYRRMFAELQGLEE
jgi:hypothetical protein